MKRLGWVNDRIGRPLVIGFCQYEVVALLVHHRRVPPLTQLCKRYRVCWLGRGVIGGLFAWLVYHLFLEPALGVGEPEAIELRP